MHQKSLLTLLMSFMVLITGCSSLLNKSDSSNDDSLSDPDFIQTNNEIDSIVSQIKDRHFIRICYRKRPAFTWRRYKYTLAPKSKYGTVLKYLKMLQHELNKYPEGFLSRAGIKYIVVCKRLSSCAFADPWGNAVYYNYSSYNNAHTKKVIHHEIYHMIEARFNGNVYYKDTAWAKLNSKDFKYDKGNYTNLKKSFHPEAGFITDYAASALEEDKADVSAGLFVEEISACLHEWIREDQILRNKVNYMKDFLLQCCDKMTSDFWEKFCMGQCSPLDVERVGPYEIQDLRFSAALSDNVTVSLIVITEVSEGLTKWWKPNGEMFDEALFISDEFETAIDDALKQYRSYESETTIDDELKQYRLFFDVKANPSPHRPYFWDLQEGRFYESRSPCFGKNGRTYPDVVVMTCRFDGNKETSQVGIGIPLGKWMTKATYNPRTKVTSGPGQGIKFDKPHREKGKLKIDISCDIPDFRKTAQQVVAVDRSGKIHHSQSAQTMITEYGLRISPRFSDLKLAQVKEFQFKTCPYTWVTFQDISLRPGKITEVQIKAEKN